MISSSSSVNLIGLQMNLTLSVIFVSVGTSFCSWNVCRYQPRHMNMDIPIYHDHSPLMGVIRGGVSGHLNQSVEDECFCTDRQLAKGWSGCHGDMAWTLYGE